MSNYETTNPITAERELLADFADMLEGKLRRGELKSADLSDAFLNGAALMLDALSPIDRPFAATLQLVREAATAAERDADGGPLGTYEPDHDGSPSSGQYWGLY